ncbi:hypothetical protein D9757_003619 [Collybiopsis confluens]|uniref:Uncharacterized protein n=1 Tax=Collybiopsis confluens TaxID=2823264 RepID=A0A8H5HUM6_9AGAR|nr:hypothetical protein D9757_003619 [Collybiopsis confluens]
MSILALIAKPFGPYPEFLILPDNLEKLIGRNYAQFLTLRNVLMMSEDETTGLDGTEYVAAPPEKPPIVEFFGIFKIQSLTWLEPQGRQWLQEELRERDQKQNNVESSGLTLETLYGSVPAAGSRISVWLRCRKIQQASFLSNEGHPKDLMLRTTLLGTKSRQWRVKSLDITTSSLSQNYLDRWRFLHFIKYLRKLDPSRPAYRFTPKFIMQAIRSHYKHTAATHRIIEADGGDGDDDPTLPRRPRHVSKSEAYGIMAACAEWFLAQQLATTDSRHVLVNIKLWHDFCIQAKKVRRRKNWKWGEEFAANDKIRRAQKLQYSNELVDGKYINLARFGLVKHGWEKRIEKHLNIVHPAPGEGDDGDGELFVDEQAYNEDEDDHGHGEYASDMDFLEPSPPPDSDSDSDSDFDAEKDEWLLSVLPWWSDVPIEWLPGQVEWHCPQEDCSFKLDLTDIQPSPAISEEDHLFLKRRATRVTYFCFVSANYLHTAPFSTIKNPKVQTLLRRMIKVHYEEHWREVGIHIFEKPGKPGKYTWERYDPERVDSDHEDPEQIKEEDY